MAWMRGTRMSLTDFEICAQRVARAIRAREQRVEQAIRVYNDVWQSWKDLDSSNVDQCRRVAMGAALKAAEEQHEET